MALAVPLLLAACGWILLFGVALERLHLKAPILVMVFLISHVPLIAALGAGSLLVELIHSVKG